MTASALAISPEQVKVRARAPSATPRAADVYNIA